MKYSRAMFFNIRYQPKKRAGLAEVEERRVDEAELAEAVSGDARRLLVLMPRKIHLRHEVHEWQRGLQATRANRV